MRWNRTELLDKLHIGGMFLLLLFVGFLSGRFASHSSLVIGSFGVAWRRRSLDSGAVLGAV